MSFYTKSSLISVLPQFRIHAFRVHCAERVFEGFKPDHKVEFHNDSIAHFQGF